MKKKINDFISKIYTKYLKYILVTIISLCVLFILYQKYEYSVLNSEKELLESDILQLQDHITNLETSTFDLELQVNIHKQYIQKYKNSNDKLNKRLRKEIKELEAKYAEIDTNTTTCEEKLKAHEQILEIFNNRMNNHDKANNSNK